MRLPRVDFSVADAARTVPTLLREACGMDGPGFFYLAMTPEESAAADRMLQLSRRFFALDGKIKEKLRNSPEQYYRYGGWRFPSSGPGFRPAAGDANFSTDERESFNVGRDTSMDDCPPYGQTPWPPEALLPEFRASSDHFSELLCQKSKVLARYLAESLELPADHFEKEGLLDRSPWLLGFVHYLPMASDIQKARFGIAPHQDDGIFTLLHTDGSKGLELCPSWKGSGLHRDAAMTDSELEWSKVEPLPGHWIVNLGTMLARWSGGRFKATLHRVVLTPDKTGTIADRYSMPFFYGPNLDAPVTLSSSTLASLPADAPRTTGDLLLQMAQRDGLELIREPQSKL